ncbi:MAG: hypothetical protein U5K77_03370 [Candidatus Saccharibacteria bacterium]|nr:hypothetical protein [Candidatus Saccharibacteria bacterium]
MNNKSQILPQISNITARVLLVIGVCAFFISGFLWFQHVYSSPRNVFLGMLENSFQTYGIGRSVEQSDDFQSIDQTILLQAYRQQAARSITDLTYPNDESDAHVVTEAVGTPKEDLIRYRSIETSEVGADNQPLDFSETIDEWGRAESSSGQTDGELFTEASLGIVPFGVLAHEDRQELTQTIANRDVFQVDYADTEKSLWGWRPQLTYTVTVTPEDYIVMLKQFAQSVELNHLEDIDPAQFSDSPDLQFQITVDVWSRQLRELVFVDSGRTERYSSHGALLPITIPDAEETISVDELQTRLQSVQ